ncbi:helix-turn-helix domain-containing protein [Leifsonia sp. ZF2019]|uniref:helix-turn-helix domain-containing protein n=1 Tax=Leifsonia sp. ZF2019 TaxID=2781978 RepID=UPI001CBD9B55|nr:helix-turn-helix domain-containing protein [Leifsonia sp. ZF2019]UAJ78360.1 helix-turn-helix domain-containing protein [Leifsonia sp. ZF2019]
MTELEDINTIEQTAAYLKLTETKVAELARTHRLAGIKEGRTWTFPRPAIEAYVEANTTTAVQGNPWGLTDASLRRVRRSA